MVRLRVLGRTRLQRSDGVELLAGHRKELILLAYLVRRRGRACTRAELADLLWGENGEARARQSLRQALANLRAALGSAIDTQRDAIAVDDRAIELDADELVEQLSAGRLPPNVDGRGEFLAGTDNLGSPAYHTWLDAEREGLRRRIICLLQNLHRDAATGARWEDAVVWAERWAELRPFDEAPHGALVEALNQCGRTTDALVLHGLFVTRLRQELDVEPSPEFVGLRDAIDRHVRLEREGQVDAVSTNVGAATCAPSDHSSRSAPGARRPSRMFGIAAVVIVAAAFASWMSREIDSRGVHAADATTRSVVARRFYEAGLRGYYQGDMNRASAMFRAALTEDSTFALAAYYALLAEHTHAMPFDRALETRLLGLVDDMPERERLFMRTRVALREGDPVVLALAETLTVRYPSYLEARVLQAQALATVGNYGRALPLLRRVIVEDSLGMRGATAICWACESYQSLVNALAAMDSVDAAERVARDWIREQPRAAVPWGLLAYVLGVQGRYRESQLARDRAATYEPGQAYDHIWPGMLAIMAGDFATADGLLREQARSTPPDVRSDALLYPGGTRELVEAQVLFEMGRFRESAAVFHRLGDVSRDNPLASRASVVARNRAWFLTHMATALGAAEFRAATIWPIAPTSPYNRSNFELARELLASGRPSEAVRPLQLALAGRIEASNYYLSRSEIHALLGRVFEAIGQPDSAAAHYRWTLRAWKNADRSVFTRRDSIRARLVALGQRRIGRQTGVLAHP